MPFFKRLSNMFWGKAETTDKPIHPVQPVQIKRPAVTRTDSLSMAQIKARSRSMSPNTRVASWTMLMLDSHDHTSRKRKRESSDSSNTSNKVRKKIEDEEFPDSLEGNTLLNGSDKVYDNVREMIESAADGGDLNGYTLVGDGDTEGVSDKHATSTHSFGTPVNLDDTVVVPEEEYIAAGYHKKRVTREEEEENQHITFQELAAAGWSIDAIPMLQKLHLRGFEPLMPEHWVMDFRFMPEGLFAPPERPELAFIKSMSGRDFHATKALTQLIGLGGRVRDKVISRKRPESLICQHICDYIAWAFKDAGAEGAHNTLIAIATGPATADPKVLYADVKAKMNSLAAAVRADCLLPGLRCPSGHHSPGGELYDPVDDVDPAHYVRAPPTVYGIIISHTIVAVVAMDAMNRITKSVIMLDFGQKDYDVWNSFALAILAIHCRNVVTRLAEEGLAKFDAPYEGPDPDL
ncbi:hypothetical protein H2203_006012 [Taxawa tesnikishii (nom. ined.)]|nr:hypothetical protein H2203_006012 [Dothideales sp. JES 119]